MNTTLNDYARYLQHCEQHCPEVVPLLPGIDPFHGAAGYSAVPRLLRIIEAAIPEERANPNAITPEQVRRMATTSGVPVWEVKQFLSEFMVFREKMRRMSEMTWWQRLKMRLGWGSVGGHP